ncbi:MAG: flagellar protein FlaG [Thermodesulfobacteriota bacterium]
MDVNVSADVKVVGQPLVSTVEMKDKTKPQVAPVAKSGDTAEGALDDQALHGKLKEELSQQDMAKIAEDIQRRFDSMGASLGFSVNEETEDIVMEVTDRESGDLIRQIPSEEVLALRAKLDELVGLLFDQEA